MKVYIAGPMRGIPENNHPAFHTAQKKWEAEGWQVFSPAVMDVAYGYSGSEIDDKSLRHLIHADILCILAADAIALLPGWEKSLGAAVEVPLAQFLSIPIYSATTMVQIFPMTKPWMEQ